MFSRSTRPIFMFISLMLWAGIYILGVVVHPIKAQTPDPFLSPPYFGTAKVTSVFDHEYPQYDEEVNYPGEPEVIPTTIMHHDGIRYEDTQTDPYGYSGHDGIDYSLSYQYVLATHAGEVVTAGWQYETNHRAGLGLRIKMSHSSGYETVYGHLGVLLVSAGIGETEIEQGTIIGISGNTGFSTGPHLHFKVEPPNRDFAVNPYGWHGEGRDPWAATDEDDGYTSYDLWDALPSISNEEIYPSGEPIILPPVPTPPLTPSLTDPTTVIIDNELRFDRYGGPWSPRLCDPGGCYGSSFYSVSIPFLPNTYARWRPRRNELVNGAYDLYAYIPDDKAYADTTLAYYKIYHNNQVHSAGIDQSRFNSRPNYPRTWAYLGRYYFSGSLETEKVEVYPEGNDEQVLAADALVWVLTDGPPTLTLSIASGSDDAGRNPECHFLLPNPEIYLGRCANGSSIVSGFRYGAVDIPSGAVITRAHLWLTVDGPGGDALRLRFYGEDNPDSLTFALDNMPENRVQTAAWIGWYLPFANSDNPDIWLVQQMRYSPNLAPVIQEIVNHPNWQQGASALTVLVQPEVTYLAQVSRRVMAYERSGTNGIYAARLLLWYQCPGGTPCPTQ